MTFTSFVEGTMINTSIWLLAILCQTAAWPQYPSIEYEHQPPLDQPERVVNGTQMPGQSDTPDYRIEEDTWLRYYPGYAEKNVNYYTFIENNRPYRISPSTKQLKHWNYWRKQDYPYNLGCYCTTVYLRLTLLAGCAVITRRHILTTASSTDLVLRYHDRKNATDLENILGAWYDMDANTWNSSVYMTPCRITYHPKFVRHYEVNHTHPLPFIYDLSVWTSTYDFYSATFLGIGSKAVICARGGPHYWQSWSPTPKYWDLAIIVGFQFVKAFRKKPMPWFKYALKVREGSHMVPCPKTEWAWYFCMPGKMWSKYGIESGAAWHRAIEKRNYQHDGLIGLNAFSLRLRSKHIVNYFTVLNTHSVLEFLYDSYTGFTPYEFLDGRFWDTKWKAPRQKPGVYVYDHSNSWREEPYAYYGTLPLY